MKVQVLGVDETLKFIGRSVTERVDAVASIYEEEARKATPIRSGRARRSWTKDVSRQGFNIENNVPYIGRLEEGYSKQAPKGISKPALRRAKRRTSRL
tara:strand:- start:440 stop:733 length:294 start_codon:yes stop_codon:yes gene_type:complete